jgi:alkyl sulfatase BDS1-like metallo-beta-lactamase superfamily hydrolase
MRFLHPRWRLLVLALLLALATSAAQEKAAAPSKPSPAPESEPEYREPALDNALETVQVGTDQKKALKVNEAIYQAIGFGNTFLVVTEAGNVVIDTSSLFRAPQHKRLLQAENAGPVKYIILTHAHGDHTGGVPLWREPGTEVIAQKRHLEFQSYQTRLADFFNLRNAAQFSLPRLSFRISPGTDAARRQPTILFDDRYEFELGGVKFKVLHTPGETPDHATVWVPRYRAAFVGDNYYPSFPNLYTLRGTTPRSPLEYVRSLDRLLALQPEILLPSHGLPIHGNAEITRRLTRYRDAIQHVHDEVVKGMNAGKDVYTLMREVKLPPSLDVGEGYGRVSWSVRGIYEGYAGWFDMNPATMYETPASAVYGDVVKLAGGPEAVARLALERLRAGQAVEALHLTDMALAVDPSHEAALEARLKALDLLLSRCRNAIERGWLVYSIGLTKEKLRGQR